MKFVVRKSQFLSQIQEWLNQFQQVEIHAFLENETDYTIIFSYPEN
jgi:hypothetical protein